MARDPADLLDAAAACPVESEPLEPAAASLTPAEVAVLPHVTELRAFDGPPDASTKTVLTYVASLASIQSKRTARTAFNRVARLLGKDTWPELDWTSLGPQETTLIQAGIVARYSPMTVRTTMAMVRGVLRTGFRLGYIDAERYQRAVLTERVHGASLPKGRALGRDEVARLKTYVQEELPGAYAVQAWAIFAAGLGGGLRLSEMAALQIDSLQRVKGDRSPGSSPGPAAQLRVYGKGAKWRLQPLPDGASSAIGHWLGERGKLGLTTDRLFVQLTRAGQLEDAPLGPKGVWGVVHRVGQAAGLEPFTVHDLRRTFATRLFQTTDIATIKTLMGHANIATTTKYDMRGQDEAGSAAAQLDEWASGAELESAHAPKDLAWARGQAEAMRAGGYSLEQIAKALDRFGLRGRGGLWLTTRDVKKLLEGAGTTP